MDIEQEREAFERHWYNFYHMGSIKARPDGRYHHPAVQNAWEAWQARAALQSQVPADPVLPYEQALAELVDNVVPGLDTGDLLADAQQASAALQSQDAEDAAQAEWMVDDGRAPWAINSLKDRIKEMRASEKRCRNAFRKDYMRVVSVYFADALGEAAEALEKRLSVIDHARRVEGDGE